MWSCLTRFGDRPGATLRVVAALLHRRTIIHAPRPLFRCISCSLTRREQETCVAGDFAGSKRRSCLVLAPRLACDRHLPTYVHIRSHCLVHLRLLILILRELCHRENSLPIVKANCHRPVRPLSDYGFLCLRGTLSRNSNYLDAMPSNPRKHLLSTPRAGFHLLAGGYYKRRCSSH